MESDPEIIELINNIHKSQKQQNVYLDDLHIRYYDQLECLKEENQSLRNQNKQLKKETCRPLLFNILIICLLLSLNAMTH